MKPPEEGGAGSSSSSLKTSLMCSRMSFTSAPLESCSALATWRATSLSSTPQPVASRSPHWPIFSVQCRPSCATHARNISWRSGSSSTPGGIEISFSSLIRSRELRLPFDHLGYLEISSICLRRITQRVFARQRGANFIIAQRLRLRPKLAGMSHGDHARCIHFIELVDVAEDLSKVAQHALPLAGGELEARQRSDMRNILFRDLHREFRTATNSNRWMRASGKILANFARYSV